MTRHISIYSKVVSTKIGTLTIVKYDAMARIRFPVVKNYVIS